MARVAKRHLVRVLVVGTAILLGAAIGVGAVAIYKHYHNKSAANSAHAPYPTGLPKKLNATQQYAADAGKASYAKDYAKVISIANDWVKNAKDDSDKALAYATKASACYLKGDKQCAADSYAAASDIKTDNFSYAYSAASYYQGLGNKTSALKYYQRALTVAPAPTAASTDNLKQDVEAKIKEVQ